MGRDRPRARVRTLVWLLDDRLSRCATGILGKGPPFGENDPNPCLVFQNGGPVHRHSRRTDRDRARERSEEWIFTAFGWRTGELRFGAPAPDRAVLSLGIDGAWDYRVAGGVHGGSGG